jgi:predicted CoA-substrate-specific enzyme activase
VAVPFSHKTITEITCHARGAMRLHRRDTLTVIDIGGQDTKIIRVVDGGVREFVMNDKCSAGTGRFLEVMATTLGMDPEQLCCLAEDGGGVSISSLCTVFAESEVITLVGRGEPRENIAFAVVDSIVKKVASQAGRLEAEGGVCLTGGLCGSAPFRAALGRALRTPVIASPEGRYAGAIGAASYGLELSAKGGAL